MCVCTTKQNQKNAFFLTAINANNCIIIINNSFVLEIYLYIYCFL